MKNIFENLKKNKRIVKINYELKPDGDLECLIDANVPGFIAAICGMTKMFYDRTEELNKVFIKEVLKELLGEGLLFDTEKMAERSAEIDRIIKEKMKNAEC